MKIFTTKDGSHSILSEKFGESYHSNHGAIEESRHVFIDAGLSKVTSSQKDIHILELGFGTGLNAFLSLIEADKNELTLQYTAIEAYPVSSDLARKLNYPFILSDGTYIDEFTKIHEIPWEKNSKINNHFSLKKVCSKFEQIDYSNLFDLVYLDAFAPKTHPEAWEISLLSKIHKSMKQNSYLVSYCAQGQFKRNLKSIGFQVEALEGPTGKREITRAKK